MWKTFLENACDFAKFEISLPHKGEKKKVINTESKKQKEYNNINITFTRKSSTKYRNNIINNIFYNINNNISFIFIISFYFIFISSISNYIFIISIFTFNNYTFIYL